ncbi:hypothetical protein F5050DRAFT_1577883, partial [Lentinula boryana]
MSAGKPEIFYSTEFCKIALEDPLLCWRSRVVRALIVPSLCSPMILGLPFLSHNHLIMDYDARSVIDKTCGFDLLKPVPLSPVPLLPSPAERRRIVNKKQQVLLAQKKMVFQEAARFARENSSFRRFTVSELPIRGFNVVAAVRARIEVLEDQDRLNKLSDSFKSEYADVFTPIAHTSELPTDFTCNI